MQISQSHIDICKSLFRGREDVYAVRWEKDGRSGYMPAYKIDWDDYNRHKSAGGTFANYIKKEYQPFNDAALKEHFYGKATVGIYPLLSDNTSFFIAADFDEDNWQESILKLHKICQKVELPAVIERSRSGNGGHLWLFFEENIPAFHRIKKEKKYAWGFRNIAYFWRELFDSIAPQIAEIRTVTKSLPLKFKNSAKGLFLNRLNQTDENL